jgi:hypothetical protein
MFMRLLISQAPRLLSWFVRSPGWLRGPMAAAAVWFVGRRVRRGLAKRF